MATKKSNKQVWPKVTRGNHLVVRTYEDGRTELEWDDDALLLEIQTAIAVYLAKKKSNHLKRYGIKESI